MRWYVPFWWEKSLWNFWFCSLWNYSFRVTMVHYLRNWSNSRGSCQHFRSYNKLMREGLSFFTFSTDTARKINECLCCARSFAKARWKLSCSWTGLAYSTTVQFMNGLRTGKTVLFVNRHKLAINCYVHESIINATFINGLGYTTVWIYMYQQFHLWMGCCSTMLLFPTRRAFPGKL